jgi:hypothetical protein
VNVNHPNINLGNGKLKIFFYIFFILQINKKILTNY